MTIYRATVDLAFGIGSKGGTNTWHLRTAGTGDLEPLRATIGGLMDAVKSFYAACAFQWPTDYRATWDGSVVEVDNADPDYQVGITPWTVTGAAGAVNWGPAPVGACVTWMTSRYGRSGRGRTFISPLSSESFEGDGTLTQNCLANIRGGAANMISQFDEIGDGAVAIYSAKLRQAFDITGAKVTDQAAVLRGRR